MADSIEVAVATRRWAAQEVAELSLDKLPLDVKDLTSVDGRRARGIEVVILKMIFIRKFGRHFS
jgi:hypothetical protein